MTPRPVRQRVAQWIELPVVQRAITALVILNAVTLGLETVPEATRAAGPVLWWIDRTVLALFVVELSLKIFGQGARFFRSGWNVFDLFVVSIALLPAGGSLSVLRALRVLRMLRVISAVPRLRFVVESLVRSMPGMGAITALLLIFFYVFSVVATKLFGAAFPQWFGSLWISGFSLFQIMTLEGWADIAREVMRVHPGAWIFFVLFILLATFTVLNLFIGLIVKAMDEPMAAVVQADTGLREEIAGLRREIAALQARLPAS